MTTTPHLAQFNIARARGPLESAIMRDFVAALDEINALAEASPGFVWRFQTEAGNALAERPYADPLIIVNLSVWESVDALKQYAFRTQHAAFLARREEWFEKMEAPHSVLWWTPRNVRPTVAEAKERLDRLRRLGPTPEAFAFHRFFPAAVPA